MSKDIHKWSDGRYTLMFDEHTFFVWDNEKDERMTALNVTKKLNEQQATNDYLEESNSRLQIQLGETLRLVDEQQATIRKLQDLCGKSDGENAKLRIENKMLEKEVNLLKPTNIEQYEQIQKLQEENEQLREEYADSLADEVKRNGLLNEEINQLRIENMRLKKRW